MNQMNQKIIHLATLTLVGFPIIGWLINWLAGGPPFRELFFIEAPLYVQLSIGAVTGAVTGGFAWMIIRSKPMASVRKKYAGIISQFNLSPLQIIYISLCAGIGEEILFRGVIQPHLGIWYTAILFVAIHGYLNPFDRKLFIYGVYMTLVIGLIGYFAKSLGLYSAMAAHTVIDVILLHQMSKMGVPETIEHENTLTEENGH